jgi:exopolyphosphatase/guanosine-5'-triphosphate,3'-diphosphate pyrophosphatase
MQRYHVDARQAGRVGKLAHAIARQFLGDEADLHLLDWTASLHEIGISVAHSGYHKHTAYILANADMPGFSKKEQAQLSMLALAQRGNLAKLKERRRDARVPAKISPANTPSELRIIGDFGTDMDSSTDYALVMSLRLAVLLHRNRSDIELPKLQGRFSGTKFFLTMEADWLAQNPLTEAALQDEVKQWKALGLGVHIEGM